MLKHSLPVVAIVAVATGFLFAKPNDPFCHVGDIVTVELTGEIAKQYAKMDRVARDGDNIEIGAEIEQLLPDGQIRFTHVKEIKSDRSCVRIIMTGTFDDSQITTDTRSESKSVSLSPGGMRVKTNGKTKKLRIHLNDFRNVKIQSWQLLREVGE